MLHLLDVFLTLLHLAIIGFNLLGWIFPATRKAHLILVVLTAGSWLILGLWYGPGYCPVTDWQWQVKNELGVRHLPPSYITWLAQKLTGHRFADALADTVTGVAFGAAAAISLYVNLVPRRRRKNVAR